VSARDLQARRPDGAAPYSSGQPAQLADVLERVLDKGIVIAGDIKIDLLDIELLTVRIRLLIASADKAREMGIDWWEGDPFLSQHRRREVAWTELCLELDALVVEHGGANDEALAHLPLCLNSLGQSAREAIDLRYRAQLRMAAIAERLKRSEGAVKLLVHRARAALKHCLDLKLKRRT